MEICIDTKNTLRGCNFNLSKYFLPLTKKLLAMSEVSFLVKNRIEFEVPQIVQSIHVSDLSPLKIESSAI